jgi:hypothetical protein
MGAVMTFIKSTITSAIMTVIFVPIMLVIASPYLSAGFFLAGPKFQEYKNIHPMVTAEIDTKHAAVYSANTEMLTTWVTLCSFLSVVAFGFTLISTVLWFFGSFIPLPLVGMLGMPLMLLQLPLIVPGVCCLGGYITWVLAYFGQTPPALLVTVTGFMPEIIKFCETNPQMIQIFGPGIVTKLSTMLVSAVPLPAGVTIPAAFAGLAAKLPVCLAVTPVSMAIAFVQGVLINFKLMLFPPKAPEVPKQKTQ